MAALIEGSTGEWEVVVGLEVHAQMISEAKLFSAASTRFGAAPNSQVSMVDAAMPGMLPVVNRFCIEQAIKTGLGLNAEINRTSVFERKNYFYPDLPAGYQISQYAHPLVGEGAIEIDLADGTSTSVGIERLHIEMDAGKSLHDQAPGKTYIDLNRSGVALMEIVSKPDIRSAEEAGAYMRKLRSILRYLGTCDGNMEEGSLRCDANISVRRLDGEYGTRCEVKNVNSIRFLQQAIDYEARRQVELIEDGGTVEQETRLFDSRKGETRPMRSKEFAHDYRYFPDPDLLPLVVEADWIDEIRANMPELPDAKKARFRLLYGLSRYNASVLVSEKEVADFFEQTMSVLEEKNPNMPQERIAMDCANTMITELFGALNKAGLKISDSPVSPDMLAQLESLKIDGTISGRIAKDVFEEMWETGKPAADIVEAKGLKQITDTGELEGIVDGLIAENPEQVQQVRDGNQKVIGWFVGQVMKATQGKANPKLVNELLRRKLEG